MGLGHRYTFEYLRDKVNQFEVYKRYFREIDLSSSFHSPLRKDTKRSVGFFKNNNGDVVYHDFANHIKYNFVEFLSKLKNVTKTEAGRIIANDFNIKNNGDIIKTYVDRKVKKEKKVFTVYKRNYTKKDLEWWGKYNITKEELIYYKIYSVKKFCIGKGVNIIKDNELCFAYHIFDEDSNGYFKVYKPTDINFKWLSNSPLYITNGLNDIDECGENLIITKSLKDLIVLKKIFKNTISLQNESSSAIKEELILELKKRYKTIYILFDIDRAGAAAANFFKKKYSLKPIFIINSDNIFKSIRMGKKLKIKDASDYVMNYGIDGLKNFIKCIKR